MQCLSLPKCALYPDNYGYIRHGGDRYDTPMCLQSKLQNESEIYMIRKIRAEDKEIYLSMAKNFYTSDAVLFNIEEKNITDTFDELMRSDLYTECFIFEREGHAAGYSLLAKTYSQEAGGMVIWIEEIFVIPEYRSKGLGREFFEYLDVNRPERIKRMRLEADSDNVDAMALYERMNFTRLEYLQMVKDY